MRVEITGKDKAGDRRNLQELENVRWRSENHRRRNQGCVSAAPLVSRLVSGKDSNVAFIFPNYFWKIIERPGRKHAHPQLQENALQVPSGCIFVYGPGDRKQASRFSQLRIQGRAVAHQVVDPVRLPP
jgi:hypothetical protein